MSKKPIKDKVLFEESKKLFKITIKNYLKYWIVFLIFSISITFLFYYLKNDMFSYISWAVILIQIFILSLYLVIFDGIPARKIRKGNYVNDNMNKEKGIVFYNALKLRTIFRGFLNLVGILITLTVVLLLIFL